MLRSRVLKSKKIQTPRTSTLTKVLYQFSSLSFIFLLSRQLGCCDIKWHSGIRPREHRCRRIETSHGRKGIGQYLSVKIYRTHTSVRTTQFSLYWPLIQAVLFKKFAKVNSIDIEVDTQDKDELVRTVCLLEPSFGGVNLEDIKGPDCFYVEVNWSELLDMLNNYFRKSAKSAWTFPCFTMISMEQLLFVWLG